ncbi:MAG: hypothetical protein ACRD1V_16425 [Vicinamibacterales bacterium]
MARMYAVDRRVYIGDEARPMYNASVFGMRLYYVPADDLPSIGRRRLLWQAAMVILFLVAFIGAGLKVWSTWWLVAAFAATPLPAALVGRWVTERYEPVSNPSVMRLVHQRVFQDREPLVAGLFCLALTFPDSARWIQRSGGHAALGVILVGAVLQITPAIIRSGDRKALEREGGAS